jgi:hypothetical protein
LTNPGILFSVELYYIDLLIEKTYQEVSFDLKHTKLKNFIREAKVKSKRELTCMLWHLCLQQAWLLLCLL